MDAKTKKQRRTPEELAAEYQRKANVARAKAKKADRDKRLRQQIELGKAALDAGLDTPSKVAAAAKGSADPVERVIAEVFARMFGPKGTITVGPKKHWEALTDLKVMTDTQRDVLFEHWQSKGWPMVGEAKTA